MSSHAGPVPALLKWGCRVGLPIILVHVVWKIFSLSFSKGVRNHSHGVFANQYWNCSRTCRSVLEVLSVSCACRSRPMVVDLTKNRLAPRIRHV